MRKNLLAQVKNTSVVAVALCLGGLTSAEATLIKVKNAQVKHPKEAQLGQTAKPPEWQIKEGGKAVYWQRGEVQGYGFRGQASRSILVPKTPVWLTPHHETEKNKHERYALFIGLKLPKGMGTSGDIAITDAQGKKLASMKIASTLTIQADGIAWCVVPHDLIKPHYGKEIRVHLRSSKDKDLVVLGTSAMLLPETAERYMVNKSNGRRGPDRYQVGALGFTGLTMHQYAPLPVYSVREGGAAEKAGLKKGDVIVAVNGKSFLTNTCDPGDYWLANGHEPVLSREIYGIHAGGADKAEIRLSVIDAKTGVTREVQIESSLGNGFEGFPFRGAASERFYKDLLAMVRRDQRPNGSWRTSRESIATSFGLLALLGSRDESHAEAIHKAADFLMQTSPETMQHKGYWDAAYIGIAVAEYALATGDLRAIQWIDRVLNPVNQGSHISKWETPVLGHGPGGLPYGNKSLLAPLIHMLTFEALAKRAGVDHGLWDYYWPFIESCWSDPSKKGHGSMGYNGSYKDKAEFWSRTGLTMIAAQLRNEKMHVHKANLDFMQTKHGWMRNSHAYGAPGNIWGMIALGLAGEKEMDHMLEAWRPIFASQWEPGYGMRFVMPHMGAPYMEGDAIYAYPMATFMSLRNKGLHITGAKDRGWLKPNPKAKLPEILLAQVEQAGEQVKLQRVDMPGVNVRFSLDGSTPDRNSPVWNENTQMPDYGFVSARYVDQTGKMGPVKRIVLNKSEPWKAIEANGHPESSSAVLRAGYAFDGDSTTHWRMNSGYGAKPAPWYVTVDRGEGDLLLKPLSGLLMSKAKSAGIKEVKVEMGDELTSLQTVFSGEIDAAGVLKFSKISKHRYLKLTILSTEKETNSVVVYDVEPLFLAPALTFVAPGQVDVAAPHKDWEVMHYTEDGRLPTLGDPVVASGRIRMTKGSLLTVRAFGKEGTPGDVSALIVPLMPADTKVKVSGSYNRGSLTPKEITDGDPKSYWHGTTSKGHPHTVDLALGSALEITGVWQIPRIVGAGNGRIKDYTISVSDDGDSWKQVHKGSWSYNGNNPVNDSMQGVHQTQHVRLTSLTGADSFANIGELAFYSLPERDWTSKIYPTMERPADVSGSKDKPMASDATMVVGIETSARTEVSLDHDAKRKNLWIAIGSGVGVILLIGLASFRIGKSEESV